MAPKKRKTSTTKVKKKKWFAIHAPAQFNETILGESYLTESDLLEGKYMTANLSTISKSMRKQNVNIQFKIEKVVEGKGYTSITAYSLINAAMKRLVRRGRDKISDSFLAKTKDKKVLRIKPLLVSLNKGTKSTQSAVRLEARRVIREFVFSKDTVDVFAAIIEGKLQKIIKEATSKIIPLKSVEIRMAKLEENVNVVLTEDGIKTEAVTIRTKDKGEKHSLEEEVEEPVDESTEDVAEAVDETASIDDDEKDQDEEAEDLIEKGEEEANSEDVDAEIEPETLLEEAAAEDAEESKKAE